MTEKGAEAARVAVEMACLYEGLDAFMGGNAVEDED
jgi:hypothetical protein